MASENTKHYFKVVMLGESGTGKTALVQRFKNNSYYDRPATIGVDVTFHAFTVDGEDVVIELWDTSGQEKYFSLSNNYYRNAHGVILVYDTTYKVSFTKGLEYWMNDIDDKCVSIDKILVGTKIDDVSERQVSSTEAMAYANTKSMQLFETSAKENIFIKETFQAMAELMMRTKKSKPRQQVAAVSPRKNTLLRPIRIQRTEPAEIQPRRNKQCC